MDEACANGVANWAPRVATAVLVLADGTVLEGEGFGVAGEAIGELCFNTAMTGYQEILTDPSYNGQIVTFTFPHIGNVGANEEDVESVVASSANNAVGLVVLAPVTGPSNHRATLHFDAWLKRRGIIGVSGIDTRALTALMRDHGVPNAIIAHHPDGAFDHADLKRKAAGWSGLVGLDLVPKVAATQRFDWNETVWTAENGYGRQGAPRYRVVAIDYGIKRNILRLLAEAGCAVTVVPSTANADDIMALRPDGVFLANGPGDPAATGEYAVPVIRDLLERRVPTFGICLGHQLLALAVGARTEKMRQGHHGANHPVMDYMTNKVEIVSMNHGFAVDRSTLPGNARETHKSLFDGSNCGLELTDRPAFSVQHHPEASPGPKDSHYLFKRFTTLMDRAESDRVKSEHVTAEPT